MTKRKQLLASARAALPSDAQLLTKAKKDGFSDKYLSLLLDVSEDDVRSQTYQALALNEAWEGVHVCRYRGQRLLLLDLQRARIRTLFQITEPKIMILGGGPNRIGQGIEFDYCCVHASLALKKAWI